MQEGNRLHQLGVMQLLQIVLEDIDVPMPDYINITSSISPAASCFMWQTAGFLASFTPI